MTKGQRHDSLCGRPDDEQGYPEAEKGWEGAKRCIDVRVVPSWARDGSAELRVTQGSQSRQETAYEPY